MKRAFASVLRGYTFDAQFPRIYNKAAQQPVNPKKILFVEIKTKEMPDSFVQMWDYLSRQGDYELEYFSLEQLGTTYWAYYKRCKLLMEKMATARCIFLCDSSDVVSCPTIRPETFVCQLWHACGAFKKWGMSTADLLFGASAKRQTRHPFYRNLDLVTVSSPEVEWAYREAMALQDSPEVVQATGVSRTDIFFNQDYIEGAQAWIHDLVPASQDKKVILYAPTFRGAPSEAVAPDQLDLVAMAQALDSEYVLLIKHHPFIKKAPPIPDEAAYFAYAVNDAPIDKLLTVSDICITDYSSVVFEFSLFERPQIFFAYDMDDYLDWRGFYYPYDEFVPGPIVKKAEEIIDYIQHVDERFDQEAMRAFKQKFMSACDGHATERIAEIALSHPVM